MASSDSQDQPRVACSSLFEVPVQIAGRNRMMRRMVVDSIKNDPDWNSGGCCRRRNKPGYRIDQRLDSLRLGSRFAVKNHIGVARFLCQISDAVSVAAFHHASQHYKQRSPL